jgi:sulfate adenylyltransferase subunit 2
MSTDATITTLDVLEAEAVHVIRECAAECARPVLLFSGGKDSIVLAHVARKAFAPAGLPFPLMHVDTGHNFPEVIEYRDRFVADIDERLIVASVEDSIAAGRVQDETGPRASRNRLQTTTLLDAIAEHEFDACFGGARRDEERARAKERFFSHRDMFGQWDPRNQRPEPWSIYNTKLRKGEHFRVFPLSNWTEVDIWSYIEREGLSLPSIYFAHEREVFMRDGLFMAADDVVERLPGEEVFTETVRFRTVGDMTCTGALKSTASTVQDVLVETRASDVSERGASRADDRTSEAAMEDRKRGGYF